MSNPGNQAGGQESDPGVVSGSDAYDESATTETARSDGRDADADSVAQDGAETHDDAPKTEVLAATVGRPATPPPDERVTEVIRRPVAPAPLDEPVTEVFANAKVAGPAPDPERRYSAPSGFDGSTQRMEPTPEPETEVFAAAVPPRTQEQPTKTAAPQAIPARGEDKPPARKRSWGWVVAVLLVIAALVAVAALATALLTRDKAPVVSQEDLVRDAITQFDTAIKKGDLAAIRSLTCGETLENYVNVDDGAWLALHERVTAAEEYPVVASIDQVVINGEHAEANVTTFMAKASEVRSTRSFDLQFRDNQWKICQGPVG